MKQFILLGFTLILALFLFGCSLDIELGSSKSERFADQAEKLAEQFVETEKNLKPLKKAKSLSNEDQELIVEQTEQLIDQIQEFKEYDETFFQKATQKFIVKKLDKRIEALQEVSEKAQTGKANQSDIENLLDELSDDVEIKLFN